MPHPGLDLSWRAVFRMIAVKRQEWRTDAGSTYWRPVRGRDAALPLDLHWQRLWP